MIHRSLMRMPSHTCWPFLYRATCQGQSPCRAVLVVESSEDKHVILNLCYAML